MTKNRKLEILLLLGVIALAAFLRLYRLEENLAFHGELGYDYMTIRDYILRGELPLIGPRTSHEWFFIGPIFYWLLMVLLPLGNYSPVAPAYFMAAIGILCIPVAYWAISKFWGKGTAFFAALLVAVSPSWIFLTRDARFNSITTLLWFPFFYFLVRALEEKGKYLIWVGLLLGAMFSFFPSPIVLLPTTVLLLAIYRKKIRKKYLLGGALALVIPIIPYFIYNLNHKFEILRNILLWIPYRIAGFFGLYPKNTVSFTVLKANIFSLYNFFRESFFAQENLFAIFLFGLLLLFFIKKAFKNTLWTILSLIFLVGYLALFFHGDPPQHYYLIIYPLPIILFAVFLDFFSKKKWGLILSLSVLCLISIFNFKYYFSEKWFYLPQDKVSENLSYVPMALQEKAARFIAEDAGGRNFSLARVGPYDYFEKDFALNYHYLLWRLGNEPVSQAELTYTIYEDVRALPTGANAQMISNLAIVKEEKWKSRQ